MATAIATAERQSAGALMEQVIVKGDLSKLSPEERARYYAEVCASVGLNPLTRPFEYITLNNKLTLYARRDAADQLRKINGVDVVIVSRSIDDGLLTVHVRAKDKTGRTDEDLGVVAIGNLKGEAQANAVLKAVTKAKRRVTLSICGLGFLDETEVEDIPGAKAPDRTMQAVGDAMRHGIQEAMNATADDVGRVEPRIVEPPASVQIVDGKRVKNPDWVGPLTKTDLVKAVNAFKTDLFACSESDMLAGLLADSAALLEQVQKDWRNQWEGYTDPTTGQVAKGLGSLIADQQTMIVQLEYARTP